MRTPLIAMVAVLSIGGGSCVSLSSEIGWLRVRCRLPAEVRRALCVGRRFWIGDALDVQRGHPRISSEAYWSMIEKNGSEKCWHVGGRVRADVGVASIDDVKSGKSGGS